MSSFRVFVRWPAAAVMAAVALGWTTFQVWSFIGRFDEPPGDLRELASAQLTGLIAATVTGAAGGSFLCSRMRRGSAAERWDCASRSSADISYRFVATATIPMWIGWTLFWIGSAIRFATTTTGLPAYLGAYLVSCAVLPVGVCIGALVGASLKTMYAVPAAIVAAYVTVLISAIFLDESWLAGLGPALGPYLDTSTSALWYPGEMLWHLGVSATMAAVLAFLTSRPRTWSTRGLIAGSLAAVVGLLALSLAGVS